MAIILPARTISPRSRQPPSTHPELTLDDALAYLDQVKAEVRDEIYTSFLDIMQEFQQGHLNIFTVIDKVTLLFNSNPSLLPGFNAFLPPGFELRFAYTHPRQGGALPGIVVRTPEGTWRKDQQGGDWVGVH